MSDREVNQGKRRFLIAATAAMGGVAAAAVAVPFVSSMLPSERAARLRADGMPVVAWTVREPAEWEKVRDGCDNLIFEGFAA